ncbi:MAG: Tol biopolymer transporter periplasmic protein [Synechococcus sp.]|nr:Tol biopolymer transporter periplasmic protein [Synechococcus sp.]
MIALAGCDLSVRSRRSAGPDGLFDRNREDPALSDGGRLLASLLSRGGRSRLVLQEQPSGRELSIGPLDRWSQHRSPGLSHNGRYLAVLVHQGERSLAVLWDRASGALHRFPLPAGEEAERLSLSPDARHLALAIRRDGRPSLRLFDLAGLLEADLPAGMPLQGGGPPASPP